MSVNLMSAIFETEFFDLKDKDSNVTKASTAKLVLLAMADHANDEGEGAYPSIERLCKKTALSEQTIRNAFDALRFNGIIALKGKSKYGTNNHTINTKSFPKAIEKEVAYLTLYPLDPPTGEATPPSQSLQTPQPVDPNHQLNTKETSAQTKKFSDPLWDLQHGKTPTAEGIEIARREEAYTDIANRLSAGLRRGEFPQTTEAQKVYRWIAEREAEGQSLDRWIQWAMDGKRAEYGFIYHKDPALIKRDWPQVSWPTTNAQLPQEGQGFYA